MIFLTEKKDGKLLSRKLKDHLDSLKDGKYSIEIKKVKDQRTLKQNRALHLFFRLLAEELNDAGYDMKNTLPNDIPTPWTGKTVKEGIWGVIQKAVLDKDSTAKLSTGEIDEIYDVVNKVIGEETGVHVDFPSIDKLMDEEYYK